MHLANSILKDKTNKKTQIRESPPCIFPSLLANGILKDIFTCVTLVLKSCLITCIVAKLNQYIVHIYRSFVHNIYLSAEEHMLVYLCHQSVQKSFQPFVFSGFEVFSCSIRDMNFEQSAPFQTWSQNLNNICFCFS